MILNVEWGVDCLKIVIGTIGYLLGRKSEV